MTGEIWFAIFLLALIVVCWIGAVKQAHGQKNDSVGFVASPSTHNTLDVAEAQNDLVHWLKTKPGGWDDQIAAREAQAETDRQHENEYALAHPQPAQHYDNSIHINATTDARQVNIERYER
jgi:hypothetical protein